MINYTDYQIREIIDFKGFEIESYDGDGNLLRDTQLYKY
jgi:hypothetical protein